jgi:hypothetical protein
MYFIKLTFVDSQDQFKHRPKLVMNNHLNLRVQMLR